MDSTHPSVVTPGVINVLMPLFLTRPLLVYALSDIQHTDEFFSLLFVDVDSNASNLAKGLFGSEDRGVAIFGPRAWARAPSRRASRLPEFKKEHPSFR